jgi:hypothetical protein
MAAILQACHFKVFFSNQFSLYYDDDELHGCCCPSLPLRGFFQITLLYIMMRMSYMAAALQACHFKFFSKSVPFFFSQVTWLMAPAPATSRFFPKQ